MESTRWSPEGQEQTAQRQSIGLPQLLLKRWLPHLNFENPQIWGWIVSLHEGYVNLQLCLHFREPSLNGFRIILSLQWKKEKENFFFKNQKSNSNIVPTNRILRPVSYDCFEQIIYWIVEKEGYNSPNSVIQVIRLFLLEHTGVFYADVDLPHCQKLPKDKVFFSIYIQALWSFLTPTTWPAIKPKERSIRQLNPSFQTKEEGGYTVW